MRAIIATLMLTAALGASADIVIGNGKIDSESRTVPAFSSIRVDGSGTLRVHRGGQKVEITSDSNILPYITTTVSGDELKIGFKPFTSILKAAKMEYSITLPELMGIRVAGSGDSYVDAFKGEAFSATVAGSGGVKADLEYGSIVLIGSGSGGFDVDVEADSLELRCSGSGGAYVRGSAGRADVAISGSGIFGARDFAVVDARITITGSGEAEIRAEKSLDVVISGSGDVRFWGSPEVHKRVSGSGRISKAGN